MRERNNVTVAGAGPTTFVFAHGFATDQTVWRLVAPSFERTSRVVLFDYVGAGRSSRSAYDSVRYRTLRGYAQDILDVLEELDLEDVVFVGHSVSAMTGMLAAIEAPARFNRLVFIAPSPRYLNDLPDYVGGFERAQVDGLLDLMDKNFAGWATSMAQTAAKRSDITRELRESFSATDPRTAREFAEATFLSDERAEVPKMTRPCLVLQCADDDIVPISVGRYLHEHLPHSTYQLLDVSGHCPQISHPKEIVSAIRAYADLPVGELLSTRG